MKRWQRFFVSVFRLTMGPAYRRHLKCKGANMNAKCGKIYCLFTLLGFMIMVSASVEALAGTEKTAESTITRIELHEDGFYHEGDFELDEQGRPVGIHDETAWRKPYQGPQDIKKGQNTCIWYKQQLPDWSLYKEYGGWILYNGAPGKGMAEVMSENQVMVQKNDKLSEWFSLEKDMTTEIVIMIVK